MIKNSLNLIIKTIFVLSNGLIFEKAITRQEISKYAKIYRGVKKGKK